MAWFQLNNLRCLLGVHSHSNYHDLQDQMSRILLVPDPQTRIYLAEST